MVEDLKDTSKKGTESPEIHLDHSPDDKPSIPAHEPALDPHPTRDRAIEDEVAIEEALSALPTGARTSNVIPAPSKEPKDLRTIEVKTREQYREVIAALKEIFTDPSDLESERGFAELYFTPELARYFQIVGEVDGKQQTIGVQMIRINPKVPDAMYTPYGGLKSDYRGLNAYPQAAILNAELMRQNGVKVGFNDVEDPGRIVAANAYPDETPEEITSRCERRINFFRRSMGMYFVNDPDIPYCRPASDDPEKIQAYDLLGFRPLDAEDDMWKNTFNEDKTSISLDAYEKFYLDMMQLEYGDKKGVPSKEELRSTYPAINEFFGYVDRARANNKQWVSLHAEQVRKKTSPNLADQVRFDDPSLRDERMAKGKITGSPKVQ